MRAFREKKFYYFCSDYTISINTACMHDSVSVRVMRSEKLKPPGNNLVVYAVMELHSIH